MKLATLLTAAGLARAGLAHAIPTFAHEKLHNERRDPAPAVKTVTTTLYQTIVWVDNNGNPVSTEIHTPPATATTVQPTPAAADVLAGKPNAASFTNRKRPSSVAAKPASSPAPQPAQQSAQPSSQAASEQAQPSSDAGAASGGSQGSSAGTGGMGICMDMINSQSQCYDSGTINSKFAFFKGQGFGIVRVYDVGCPVGDYTAAAKANGMKVMIGVNAIANLQGDLGKLISMVNGDWSSVDTVYIGNELVNNGAASASQVAGAVSSAKGTLSAAGFSGSVVTVDTFNQMTNDPTICSTSDYCAANAHAFFDPNTSASGAGKFVLNAYNSVAQANGGKKVVITESGWPTAGGANGQAVPSKENQNTAMASVKSSFSGMPGNIFLFQAFDAGYKSGGSLGVEQHFGIFSE